MASRRRLWFESMLWFVLVMVVCGPVAWGIQGELPPLDEAQALPKESNGEGSAGETALARSGPLPPPPLPAEVEQLRVDWTVLVPEAVGFSGATPELVFSYNSSRRNGWVGVGWDLDVGRSRDRRSGG